LSGSTAKPGSNGQRAAAVQRLKAAIAERRQVREHREAGKAHGRLGVSARARFRKKGDSA
jgi:hypothetical protein